MAKDFTMVLLVEQSAEEVYDAVLNVRGWWQGLYSEDIKGTTHKVNDEFTFRAGNGAHYTEQKLIEAIPNKKVVWRVTHSELSFVDKPDEWEGSKIIFEIDKEGSKTKIEFTHQGLTPKLQCYESCSNAWSRYLQEKLLSLIHSVQKMHDRETLHT
ncbi:MAG: SRPBCC domain-containing protein [Chryseolinea sp.]